MSKQVVYAITIVLCILLQAGISPAIAIMGCSPNFLLIPVLLISMRSGTGMGSIAGFLLGLLYDLMGSGTIGCMALVFTDVYKRQTERRCAFSRRLRLRLDEGNSVSFRCEHIMP